jgi:hypothetical protein
MFIALDGEWLFPASRNGVKQTGVRMPETRRA